jgi:CRP/FNR family transcriptional regulator, nitrogen oxide reductase regulator
MRLYAEAARYRDKVPDWTSRLPIEPASVRLFAGLGRDQIGVILAAGIQRKFKASELIIRAEEPATRLFLITSGYANYFVVTSTGHEVLLRRLVPGDVIGVGSFLSDPAGYLGSARTVRPSEALTWEHRTVRQLAKTYPVLVENALRKSLRYIALYAQRHIGLVSDRAAERLASALTNLGSRAGHALPRGIEVEITNEDLASLADLSFFTVSRIFKQWEHEGTVEKSRGRVLIRRPEKLLA